MEKVFEYNSTPVTFSKREDSGYIMVNATEMARPFGKKPAEYLRLPSTKALIKAIVGKSLIAESQIVMTRRGGDDPSLMGTWMHEDLALDFAQWLSIDFKLWCNDRIKELLLTGQTQIDVPSYPDALRRWAQAIEDKERAEAEAREKQLLHDAQAPKVIFADAVVGSKGSILVGELAKILTQNGFTIGQNRLFGLLRDEGYLGTIGEQYNIPNQKYVEMGLFEIKKNTYSIRGEMQTSATVKVTNKGQQYLINKFLGKNKQTEIQMGI